MGAGVGRQAAIVAACAALVVLTLWLLDLFARHEFAAHLRGQAAYALALAATGGTPYDWRFRAPDEVVAGHPFGARTYAFEGGGLSMQAGDADMEVGLPLTRPVDLRSFPQLRLSFDARTMGRLRVVVGDSLDSAGRSSQPIAFTGGEFRATIDLSSLDWNAGAGASAAPTVAAMLRIRYSRDSDVLLRGALLQRPVDYAPIALAADPPVVDAVDPRLGQAVYRLPFAPLRQQAAIAAIVAKWTPPSPPLVLLPQRGRVEQQIALRNAVYAALPAAILIPEGEYAETFAQAREYAATRLKPVAPNTGWALVAGFGALLILARWRPPRHAAWRALLEIGLALAAPLWLVVSGRIDGSTLHAPQTVLIGFSLIYAISLSLHPSWRFNGTLAAWTACLTVVLLAVLIGIAAREAGAAQSGARVLRHFGTYLGWALLQQFLICAICTERWRIATGSWLAAAYLGALCFALLHTPNAALMLATFVGGLLWCTVWLRYRALLPLAVSHAGSALALSALLPPDVLHSAEVSVRFFQ